jgi:hypothetical protein
MPGAPPYGAIAERRLIQRLLAADAVRADSAHALDHLRAIEQRRLRRLISAGVVREAGGGRYYLDPPALAARMASRRVRVMIAMFVVVGLVAAMAAWTTYVAAR